MSAFQALISELEQEVPATRRLLERVPEDKFGWKPHDKSMSLGQLAYHIASVPGNIANLLLLDGLDASQITFERPTAKSRAELMKLLDDGIANAKKIMSGLTETQAIDPWKLVSKEKEVFTVPKIGVARTILLNHWYHHRGQLTVYLRLLDVNLPVTYGRSADENPFQS
jgi:uncharacterized damage-inducible protein DinB